MQPDSRVSRSLRSVLFGDRPFYRMVLVIAVPIIVQNAISSFVNLLDNIMVGRLGTEQMSGVSIANQLLFVFNLCIFGGISGAGIFSAQFHGAKNDEGVRSCFRYKVFMAAGLVLLALAVYLCAGKSLVMLYLNDASDVGRVDLTLSEAMRYLHMMLWNLAPFAMTNVYAGTLRETGETRVPMVAGISAVFVNLLFNWVLIFGHFGFPALGVRGAALATVISRLVELGIVVIYTHTHRHLYPFARGLYRTLKVPVKLAKDITIKGLPLLINEGFWSMGMAMLSQCYSLRGLDVVAAMNISSTISNLFSVTFLATGAAAAIIVGQALGSGDMELARQRAWHMIVFSILVCAASSLLMLIFAPLIPHIYRTEESVRHLATSLLIIYALCMPLFSFANSAYFILRSGGKTMITFLFDSGYTWLISVPIAWLLAHYTGLPIVTIYLTVQLADILKCAFGFHLIKKGVWLNNLAA